jgi:hypothetical protein
MTDIPAMIIAKNNGGKSIAVYPRGKEEKVHDLYKDGRVNYVCPADYRAGMELEKVMQLIIQGVAINERLRPPGKPRQTRRLKLSLEICLEAFFVYRGGNCPSLRKKIEEWGRARYNLKS